MKNPDHENPDTTIQMTCCRLAFFGIEGWEGTGKQGPVSFPAYSNSPQQQ